MTSVIADAAMEKVLSHVAENLMTMRMAMKAMTPAMTRPAIEACEVIPPIQCRNLLMRLRPVDLSM
jgi:hypothetical protein